jgi:amidophosphoribosyltransferase
VNDVQIDTPEHSCGVLGIFSTKKNVAKLGYIGLMALQHRGQEAAGIAVSNGCIINIHKGVGFVSDVIKDTDLEIISGNLAIGHTRYSTTGISDHTNIQPMSIDTNLGKITIAHNGHLTNASSLRTQLVQQGATFKSSSDTEVMLQMLALDSGSDWIKR